MPETKSNEFTVTFGKVARTVDYEDSQERLVFTFDAGSKFDFKNPNGPGKNSICLEHYPPSMSRSPRYGIAFERTKQFLESRGFDVEIYGE
jgi:hypothetical protein